MRVRRRFGGLALVAGLWSVLWSVQPRGAAAVGGTVRLSVDGQPVPGLTVRYTATDGAGAWTSVTDSAGWYDVRLPVDTAVGEGQPQTWVLSLGMPFPNPFNPTTVVPVEVDVRCRLRLRVFGALGQVVRVLLEDELEPGRYAVPWDGRDDDGRPVAAGVYLLCLDSRGRQRRGKVTLVDGAGGGVRRPGPALHAPAAAPVARAFDVEVTGDGVQRLVLEAVHPQAPGYGGDLWVEAAAVSVPLPGGRRTALRGVPAGVSPMGSDWYQDEQPPHAVRLSGYLMQQREVTVAEYGACVAAGACVPAAAGDGCNGPERGDHPVNCVSARDAERYCAWAGLRLPTEAEWEKAARGSQGRRYPWGDEPPGGAGNCDRAVMMRAGLGLGCGWGGTAPAGSCAQGRSPYGIEDLAGNVWEWTADTYDRTYYARGSRRDPVNREAGTHRVLRGNSWYYCDPDPDLRAANRYRLQPLRWNPYTGFRCAWSRVELAAPQFDVAVEERALAQADWMERNRVAQRAEGDTLPGAPGPGAEEMIEIPAGEFTMGSEVGESDEAPARTVYLDSYSIDRYEVTVEAYDACVADGACQPPHTDSATYSLPFEAHYLNGSRPGRRQHPVNGVSWHDAAAYCAWAGKRLPTEAEWEKAARGDDGRPYPWGSDEPDCGRIIMDDGGDGCGHEMAWPVGSKPAGDSPYGVGDLAGNLWEWVDDWYAHGYYGKAPDRNPHNTERGAGHKVLRGGSMADQNPRIHRAANRLAYDPAQRFDYTVGFRCARGGRK